MHALFEKLIALGFKPTATGVLVASADGDEQMRRVITDMQTRDLEALVAAIKSDAADLGGDVAALADAGELTGGSSHNLGALNLASVALGEIRCELDRRRNQVADILRLVDELDDENRDAPDEQTAAAAQDGGEGAAESEETDTSGGADAMAAAATPARSSQARKPVKVPARHTPRGTKNAAVRIERPGGVLVASLDEVGDLMYDRAQSVAQGMGGPRELIASLRWRYSDHHHLDGTDADNSGRIDGTLRALVAAGGIPGPAEPRYDMEVLGQDIRPLRDGLPRFTANRGEIVYHRPPVLADVVIDSAGGAITTVTSAEDASGKVKTAQAITIPTDQTATVRAVADQLRVGNFTGTFRPELFRDWAALTVTAHARRAEQLLLTDIATESVRYTDTPAKMGAFRDLKAAVEGVVAELRNRARDYTTPVTLALPIYVIAMCVVDLTRQQPGDATWDAAHDRMRATIESWAGGLNVIWLIDGTNGSMLTTPTANGRSATFDADVDWWAWFAGTFLFLDGGSLDLGVYRDATLTAANTFGTFYEGFEGLARVGPYQGVHVVSSLCCSGSSQIATNIAVCSPSNS